MDQATVQQLTAIEATVSTVLQATPSADVLQGILRTILDVAAARSCNLESVEQSGTGTKLQLTASAASTGSGAGEPTTSSVAVNVRGRRLATLEVEYRPLGNGHPDPQLRAWVDAMAQLLGLAIDRAQWMNKSARLEETLATRKLVERAKGVLMETLGLTEAAAFSLIRRHSMAHRTSMRETANAVLAAHEQGRLNLLTDTQD